MTEVTRLLAVALATIVVVVTADDRAVLLDIYEHTQPWSLNVWENASMPVCSWRGVSCDHTGRVSALDVEGFGLIGGLPASLSQLTHLRSLVLDSNHVDSLPKVLPPALETLSVSTNVMVDLDVVDPVPPLRVLVLDNNIWRGFRPPGIVAAVGATLTNLSLSQCRFDVIGDSFAGLSQLVSLNLLQNDPVDLWRVGEIPGPLRELRLEGVGLRQMSVRMPESFRNFRRNLTVLDLFGARYESIDPIRDMVKLESLHILGAWRLRALPAALELPRLQHLTISFCAVLESVLDEDSHLPALEELYLSDLPNVTRIASIVWQLDTLKWLEIDTLSAYKWDGLPASLAPLKRLSSLTLSSLPFLRRLPDFHENIALTSLKIVAAPLDDQSGVSKQFSPFLQHLHIEGTAITAFPARLCENTFLSSLTLTGNDIQSVPDECLKRLTILRTLDLAHNPRLSLPNSFFCDIQHAVRSLFLTDCGLKSLPPLCAGGLPVLTKIELDYNHLESVPAFGPESAGTLHYIEVSHNRLLSLDVRGLPRLDSLFADYNQIETIHVDEAGLPKLTENVRLAHNRLADTPTLELVLRHFCGPILDLSHNRLTNVTFLGDIASGLDVVDLSFNPLHSVPVMANTEVLSVRGCQTLTGIACIPPSAVFPRLKDLDVSDTPLRVPVSVAFQHWLTPQLVALTMANCSLYNGGPVSWEPQVGVTYQLATLDMTNNPAARLPGTLQNRALVGVFPLLEALLVGHTYIQLPYPTRRSTMPELKLLDVSYTRLHVCVGDELFSSPSLRTVLARGLEPVTTTIDRHADLVDCSVNIGDTLTASRTRSNTDTRLNGLTCPEWLLPSGASFDVDAAFVRFHQCECPTNHYFEATCRPCPSPELECDPAAVDPVHRLKNVGFYPLLPNTCQNFSSGLCLVHSTILRCHHPMACNVGTASFECRHGHDVTSLLCSRCLDGFFRVGGLCVECHPAYAVVFPIGLCVMLAVFVWYALRRDLNSKAQFVSVSVFYIQLLALLETTTQTAATASNTVSPMQSLLQELVSIRPWAFECVSGDTFTFTVKSWIELSLPFAAVLLGLCAAVVRSRVRAVFVGCFALELMYLPLASKAVQLVSCTTANGRLDHAVLSSAPWVACDDVKALRAMAMVELVVFVVAYPVVTFWVVRKKHGLFWLVRPFREGAWWFPIVLWRLRSLVLAVIVQALPFDSAWRPLLVLLLLLLLLGIIVTFRPYERVQDHMLACFLLGAAVVLYQSQLIGFSGFYETHSTVWLVQVLYWLTIMIIVATPLLVTARKRFSGPVEEDAHPPEGFYGEIGLLNFHDDDR